MYTRFTFGTNGFRTSDQQSTASTAPHPDMASRLLDLTKLGLGLQARLAQLEGAERRAAELERTVEQLKADNDKLLARIRELEIGFRRFVSEAWAELKKVEWPGQSQVIQGTIVVIIACAIVGAYLWLVDLGFKPFVRDILIG